MTQRTYISWQDKDDLPQIGEVLYDTDADLSEYIAEMEANGCTGITTIPLADGPVSSQDTYQTEGAEQLASLVDAENRPF